MLKISKTRQPTRHRRTRGASYQIFAPPPPCVRENSRDISTKKSHVLDLKGRRREPTAFASPPVLQMADRSVTRQEGSQKKEIWHKLLSPSPSKRLPPADFRPIFLRLRILMRYELLFTTNTQWLRSSHTRVKRVAGRVGAGMAQERDHVGVRE